MSYTVISTEHDGSSPITSEHTSERYALRIAELGNQVASRRYTVLDGEGNRVAGQPLLPESAEEEQAPLTRTERLVKLLHHLAEYHERGGLFRLSFSATPTNGAGSRTTYEPGRKVITEVREKLFPTPPIRAKVGDIIEITNPGSDDDPAVKGCRFTVLHVMDGSGFVVTKERPLGFFLGEFEVVG